MGRPKSRGGSRLPKEAQNSRRVYSKWPIKKRERWAKAMTCRAQGTVVVRISNFRS